MEIQKVSKSRIKYLQSLKLKKNRQKYAVFTAEGRKVVQEFIKCNDQIIKGIYGLNSWIEEHLDLLSALRAKVFEVTVDELKQMSMFTTPDQVLIECEMLVPTQAIDSSWILYLDGISDPGNLGTIIRTADWFGLKEIYLSHNSVDVYNPKVVHATMGSLARIPIKIAPLREVCDKYERHPCFVAQMKGENIRGLSFGQKGILVLGNESHGTQSHLTGIKYRSITIAPHVESQANSLNVAIAAGILLHHLVKG